MNSLLRIACVLGAGAVVIPGALADSPAGTTTAPVSTVTTLPTTTTQTIPAPKPDAPVVKKTAHPRAGRVVAPSASVVHRTLKVDRAAPPTHSSSSTPKQQHSPAVATTHPAKTKAVGGRRRPRPPSERSAPQQTPPVSGASEPARSNAPTPTTRSTATAWVTIAVIGGLITLLLGLGLVGGIRTMRRTADQTTLPPVVRPPSPPAPTEALTTPTDGGPTHHAPISTPLLPTSCRIAWWRGYVHSRFYAYEENGLGETTLVAESPSFSWHSSEPPPESPAVLAAHARLVETLERLGWQPNGIGEAWFSGCFRRPSSTEPQQAARAVANDLAD